MELQHKLINLIKPAKPANEREAYSDWAKYVMVRLHPTLWRQFQAGQSALFCLHATEHLDLDDRARGTQAQQQTQQVSQQQSQCDLPWQLPPPPELATDFMEFIDTMDGEYKRDAANVIHEYLYHFMEFIDTMDGEYKRCSKGYT